MTHCPDTEVSSVISSPLKSERWLEIRQHCTFLPSCTGTVCISALHCAQNHLGRCFRQFPSHVCVELWMYMEKWVFYKRHFTYLIDTLRVQDPSKWGMEKTFLYLVPISVHRGTFPKSQHGAPRVVCMKHHHQPSFFIIWIISIETRACLSF